MLRATRLLIPMTLIPVFLAGCEKKSVVDSGPLPTPVLTQPSAAPTVSAQPSAAVGEGKDKLRTTASGLKYMDLEVGDGPRPSSGQTVTVKYVGKLENGKVFDRGRIDFPIGDPTLVKGWNLGVGGARDFDAMKVGGRRLIVLPPDLAFGNLGSGATVPPNATVSFEIELLKVAATKAF